MVVEITPIGIQSLHWKLVIFSDSSPFYHVLVIESLKEESTLTLILKHFRFYIIWTIFNASFVPIVYFFYPETADRTLEDVDRLFRENQNVGSISLLSPVAKHWLMLLPDIRFQTSRCHIHEETIGVH